MFLIYFDLVKPASHVGDMQAQAIKLCRIGEGYGYTGLPHQFFSAPP